MEKRNLLVVINDDGLVDDYSSNRNQLIEGFKESILAVLMILLLFTIDKRICYEYTSTIY